MLHFSAAVGMALSLLAAVSAGLLETISMQRWNSGYVNFHLLQCICNFLYLCYFLLADITLSKSFIIRPTMQVMCLFFGKFLSTA